MRLPPLSGPESRGTPLSRTYTTLLEALNRHRGKGQQKVTVEHVHVHQGGQAIVGHVQHNGEGVRAGLSIIDFRYVRERTNAYWVCLVRASKGEALR
jgi:hypothetical protein